MKNVYNMRKALFVGNRKPPAESLPHGNQACSQGARNRGHGGSGGLLPTPAGTQQAKCACDAGPAPCPGPCPPGGWQAGSEQEASLLPWPQAWGGDRRLLGDRVVVCRLCVSSTHWQGIGFQPESPNTHTYNTYVHVHTGVCTTHAFTHNTHAHTCVFAHTLITQIPTHSLARASTVTCMRCLAIIVCGCAYVYLRFPSSHVHRHVCTHPHFTLGEWHQKYCKRPFYLEFLKKRRN